MVEKIGSKLVSAELAVTTSAAVTLATRMSKPAHT
jgi:hypothetical protein